VNTIVGAGTFRFAARIAAHAQNGSLKAFTFEAPNEFSNDYPKNRWSFLAKLRSVF
jgi:hypothetical protein